MDTDNVILKVVDISKSFSGVQALKNVNIEIEKGEVHAICGENGAGKSTLVQILSGVYMSESGHILLNGKKILIKNQKNANELGISIVYQDRSLVSGLSIAENIFAARQPVNIGDNIDWKKLYAMTQELLNNLGLSINPKAVVGTLSPAQQQMVEIAKALSLNPSILILDEPTSTATQKEVVILFNIIKKLKSEGKSIIYITHRISEIFEIADRVSVLKDGCYMGTEYVKNIDQNWVVNKMIGREIHFSLSDREIENEVIFECKNFSNNKNFRNINFYLKKGEMLSFAGLTGAGRSELFKSIIGALPKISGEIYFEGKSLRIRNPIDAIEKGIVYLPEDRKDEGLFLSMSVSWNMVSASLKDFQKGPEMNDNKIIKIAKKYVNELSIDTPSINQQVINLSGGNQQKVVLSKFIIANSNIFIVDEPTRGVDVGVKIEIYKLLRKLSKEGKSIIIISSDLPEILSISDRIYVMWNGILKGEILRRDATEEKITKMAYGIEIK